MVEAGCIFSLLLCHQALTLILGRMAGWASCGAAYGCHGTPYGSVMQTCSQGQESGLPPYGSVMFRCVKCLSEGGKNQCPRKNDYVEPSHR